MMLLKCMQMDGGTLRVVYEQGGVQSLLTLRENGIPQVETLGRPFMHPSLGFMVSPAMELIADAGYIPVNQSVDSLDDVTLKEVYRAATTD